MATPETALASSSETVVSDPGPTPGAARIQPSHERPLLPPSGPSLVSLADQAVVSATSFLTGVILGRALTKEHFGLYMLGLTVVGLARDLQACVVSTPYTIRGPQLGGSDRTRYAGSVLVHQLGIIVLFVLTVSAGAHVLASRGRDAGLVAALSALGLAGGGTLLWYHTRAYLFANLNVGRALALDSVLSLLQLGGLVALAIFGWLTTPRAFVLIGIAGGLAATVVLICAAGALHVVWRDVWPDFGKSWRTGRWILASTLLWSAGNQLYPWLLAVFHGTGAAGVWAASLGIVAIANPVFLGLQNSVGPRMAHAYAGGGVEGLRSSTARALSTFAAFVGPFTVGTLLAGGPATALVYGPQYGGTGVVVGVLGLYTLLVALAFPISRALFLMDRARVDFAINTLPLGLMLTLGVWLVRSHGAVGAAVTMLAGSAAALVLRYAAFRRATRLSR